MVRTLQFAVIMLIAMIFAAPLYAMTSLTARIDKNPALQGEAITLEVIADSRVAADAINFRVLEQDFTVMVPSVSSSTQIINGQSSQSTSWKVVLLPKQTGEIDIPAFQVNGFSTEPIRLTVLDTPMNKAATANAELFLQTEIEQSELYVQQLTYYQVTIFFNGDLQRGSLSEPEVEGASVTQVGQDSEGTELVNGIRYRTITRRYAITPQRSGNFTINPVTFSGEMIDRDSARYNYFARTKPVVQQGQPIDITVKAIPADFPGDWLVAGLVTLTEEWTPDVKTLKLGEPVTRIVTLSAVDVTENQLPELKQEFPDGLRLYQEQPQAKSAQRNGRLVAQKVFTTAVIANKAGTLELPEMVLPWWNSQTNQPDFARLPARQLTVAEPASSSSKTAAVTQPSVGQVIDNTSQHSVTSNWQWNYLSSVLLALWLVSCFVCYVFWQLKMPHTAVKTAPARVKFDDKKLKQACDSNNAAAAKAELLRFAHQQLDKRCTSLSELAQLLPDEQLKHQLQALNAALYSAATQPWQGQSLWDCWQQSSVKLRPADATPALSPLYPHSKQ